MLVRDGREQPLIPRYFDLLVFLIEHRGEAVHRRDIFDRVWSDVVVSDSALSQAIRTIRRVLGDDSREPRFVRTVSRHGYRFVFADVVEEDDDGEWPAAGRDGLPSTSSAAKPSTDPVRASPPARDRVATSATEEERAARGRRAAARARHVRGACDASALALVTRSRGRCCATRAGTRRRPARCRFSASPSPSPRHARLVRLRLRRAAASPRRVGRRVDWRRPGGRRSPAPQAD